MYRYMLCALQRFNTFFYAVQHTVPSKKLAETRVRPAGNEPRSVFTEKQTVQTETREHN